MTVVLWHIELSHYNEKARWALDYKSIEHELRVPMPGLHGARALMLTRGKHRRLPVMELEGRRIGDSTAIIAALEAYQPEPALYPADPAEKARALELEDFFDEELAPQMRRLVWHHTLPDTDAVVESLFARPGAGLERASLRATAPAVRPFIPAGDYGVSADSAEGRARPGYSLPWIASRPSYRPFRDTSSVIVLSGRSDRSSAVHAADRSAAPTVHAGHVPGRGGQPLREELTAARHGGRWIHEMYQRHRRVGGAARGVAGDAAPATAS